jgi:hypothetical protein
MLTDIEDKYVLSSKNINQYSAVKKQRQTQKWFCLFVSEYSFLNISSSSPQGENPDPYTRLRVIILEKIIFTILFLLLTINGFLVSIDFTGIRFPVLPENIWSLKRL